MKTFFSILITGLLSGILIAVIYFDQSLYIKSINETISIFNEFYLFLSKLCVELLGLEARSCYNDHKEVNSYVKLYNSK